MNSLTTSVCFIDFFAYSLFNSKSNIVFGGAQIQLYLLAKELAKDKKLNISFLTDNRQTTRQETFNNIKVYQFLRSPKIKGIYGRFVNLLYMISLIGYLVFFIRLFIQIKKINADIYIQRAASAETGLIAIITRILRKKFIFMVAHQNDINGQFVKQNGFRGKLYLLGLKLADTIVCQTKEQADQLDKKLKNKSLVIQSGYPIKKQDSFTKVKKQGILWVARAEAWKQPSLFINLAKKFPQEKFIMICPPAENNPDYFEEVKKEAGKIKNLTFIEKVPFKEIDSYFKKAKVFVSTSFSEGFPNTFIQASKNMTPIISFKVNPDKIIEKYQLGYWAKGDEHLMSLFLRKILKDKKSRLKFSVNAYKYALGYHNITKSLKKFKKLLLKLSQP